MRLAGRVVLACIVGIIGAELALRLFLGLGAPPLLTADDEIGYLFQANQDLVRFTNRVHINGYHQRSEDVVVSDSARTARVLFLGDSITWGGVLTDQSKTYPELFEARLADWCDHPVETLNASAGSWGIGNLRAYAERFGFFGSDLVVVQVGEGDLTQPTSDSSGVGNLCSLPRRAPTFALREFFECYGPRITSRLAAWTDIGEQEADSPRPEPNQSPEVTSRERDQFDANMGHLQALVDSIRKAGKPLAVIYVPERDRVTSENAPPPLYPRFRRWVERRDIPLLDLQAQWQGESGVREYYRDYIHPNEQGNRVLAESLGRLIRSEEIPVCGQSRPLRRE